MLGRFGGWLYQQPYLLVCITYMTWALNIVLGRYVAGHFPPVALSFLRWGVAFLIVLPFAWPYLKRDWPVIRRRLPILTVLAITGTSAYNTMAYWGLQYTRGDQRPPHPVDRPPDHRALDLRHVRRPPDASSDRRHPDFAGRRDRDHLPRRHRGPARRVVQSRRHLVLCGAGDLRLLFGADEEASGDAPAFLPRLLDGMGNVLAHSRFSSGR